MSRAATSTTSRAHVGAEPDKRSRLLLAIQRLEKRAGGSTVHRLALAEAQFRLAVLPESDPQEAIQCIQRAIDCDPFHPKFYFHLGRLLHRTGDLRGAVFPYRQALKLAPASHRACVHLAMALCELGEAEKEIGRGLLDALFRGASCRELMVQLDELLAAQLSAAEKGQPPPVAPRKTRKAGDGTASQPTESCRWAGVWRLSLVEHLSRPKPLRKQMDERLSAGAKLVGREDSVTEYAVLCLCLLLGGDPPAAIRALLREGVLQAQEQHVAVRLLSKAVSLAEIKDLTEFVGAATEAMESGDLPAEVVCCLHYLNFPPGESLSAGQALALLNEYPPSVQECDCFRELKLAVLDGYARRAWAEEEFDYARVMWREALSLDRYRIAVAHNLALLAARAKSRDDYQAAWQRAAELRYLQAAAAGDLQVCLEERRTMHRALAQQSQRRYCPPGKSSEEKENLVAWVADRDALDVFLREWDLYYLNSRLRFRSSVHRLGIPRDASPEVSEHARDFLLRQIEMSLPSLPWAGVKTFCDLAKAAVLEAFERCSQNVERARDPFYDQEKTDADELLGEVLNRAVLLNGMIVALSRNGSAGSLSVGCAIAKRLFALPWKVLEPICTRRGWGTADRTVVQIFEDNFLGLAASDKSEPKSDQEISQRLSALEECFAILPHRVKEASIIKGNLSILIDNIAFSALPENLRRPTSRPEAERTLSEGRRILERFPRAGGLRAFLAEIMIQVGDRSRLDQAIELLEQGLECALHDDQTKQFQASLDKARERLETAGVIEEIKNILESASANVSRAIQEFNSDASAATLKRTRAALNTAIRDAERARQLAEKAKVDAARDQADELARQFEQILEKLRER